MIWVAGLPGHSGWCSWEKRQALEGAHLAPGTEATLQVLHDPEKRPLRQRERLLENDSNWTKNCFCSVSDRPGGGQRSGMTADHLQPILESGRDAVALASFATSLAQGEVPPEALEGIRMGDWLQGPFRNKS